MEEINKTLVDKKIRLAKLLVKSKAKHVQNHVTLEGGGNRNSVTIIPRRKQEFDKIEKPCTLFIDQSTDTGYALFDKKKRLVMLGALRKSGKTGLGDYKFSLEALMEVLIEEYGVETVVYEEVYDHANRWTTEVLHYIKHTIKDLETRAKLEDSDKKLTVMGVDHLRWKKELASPNKFSPKKGKDKEEVEKHVSYTYPLLLTGDNRKKLTEDMIDALGMGIGVLVKTTLTGKMYHKARYDKRLPIDVEILDSTRHKGLIEFCQTGESYDDYIINHEEKAPEIDEAVSKLRKPFREAYEVGDVVRLDYDKGKLYADTVRQYLSHIDQIVVTEVTKDYRYWGYYLLMLNKDMTDIEPDGTYYIAVARRRRR